MTYSKRDRYPAISIFCVILGMVCMARIVAAWQDWQDWIVFLACAYVVYDNIQWLRKNKQNPGG